MSSYILPANLLQPGILSPWGQGLVRSLLLHRLPKRSQTPLGIHLDLCSPRISMGCRSTAATALSSQELQANLCSSAGAFHPPPSALTWASGLFLSYVAPLVAIAVVQIFLLLCNSVSPNSLPSSLMGLDGASGVSVLDPPGTGEASDSFSQQNYSCSPPLQKPCHTNTVQQQRNDIFNTGITGHCHDSCVDPDSMPPMMRLLN